jgi:serine protease
MAAVAGVVVTLLAAGAAAANATTANAAPANAAPASAADYVPGEVVIGYAAPPNASLSTAVARRMGVRSVASSGSATEQVVRLAAGVSVSQAVAQARRQPGVAYAVPDYIAHAAGSWLPDDPGGGQAPGGWQGLQWNFLATTGVDAPGAWANLIADGRPGGRGATIAILDTGIAYRTWHQYTRSPDFGGTRFVDPYDFVAHNAFPLDENGHGTFVAGTVAEATNNRIGAAGLAYGASIMPVRVLDATGDGDAVTIARGIRYAVNHGAQVINLSLEFDLTVTAGDIPSIIDAIGYAHRRGVVVVAAAGNDSASQLAYPARAHGAISVGATTRDLCLADYSDVGPGLDLVAPGGGDDSSLLGDPNCHPDRNLPGIFQMTFADPFDPRQFSLPAGWYGTSMAAPHVTAAAALVIASRVIGAHPTPDQVLARLEQTARILGGSKPNPDYGYGLIDAGAATAPSAATIQARRQAAAIWARRRHTATTRTKRRAIA